jgi:hypothetical protein
MRWRACFSPVQAWQGLLRVQPLPFLHIRNLGQTRD